MTVGQYVTAEGLIIPTVEEIVARTAADMRASPALGSDFDTSPDSPQGQINGILSSHNREGWEALQIAYNALNGDAAEDTLLDILASVTGTFRAAATPSRFDNNNPLVLTLQTGALIPAGSLVGKAGSSSVVFRLTQNVQATDAGEYTVEAEATAVGPIAANAHTITEILTPISGWDSVDNPQDAHLGTAENSDQALRSRRVAELSEGGVTTLPAVTSALLQLTTVDNIKPIQAAITYENSTDFFDSVGRPPHCIEAVIFDGDSPTANNNAVAQIILNNDSGGIPTFGNQSGVAIDYVNGQHIVMFSRAIPMAVKAEVRIAYNLQKGSPSEQQVKDAITASFAAKRKLGQVSVRWNWFDVALTLGAIESTSIKIGLQAGSLLAAFTDLPVPPRQIATLDSSHISVILTGAAE